MREKVEDCYQIVKYVDKKDDNEFGITYIDNYFGPQFYGYQIYIKNEPNTIFKVYETFDECLDALEDLVKSLRKEEPWYKKIFGFRIQKAF